MNDATQPMRESSLRMLEDDVRRSLRYLGDDPPNWVPARPGVDHDVMIVGAGQSGITTAFALRRAGIGNVAVIDGAAEGEAGAWAGKARMKTLRTPKKITGPELGIPALSFRAWYEARHGVAAFDAVGRILLTDWAAYIRWYQAMVSVPVRHATRLMRIEPAEGHFRLHLSSGGTSSVETTRKVVLAMGMSGSGAPGVPALVRNALAPERYAHTEGPIDFGALRGKRIAVIGAASSAFDAAGVALETGAAEVHLYCRDRDLARVAREWPLGYPGAGNNFFFLSDHDRWHLGRVLRARSPGPMPDTVRRATQFRNFYLHLEAPLESIMERGSEFMLATPESRLPFDFLILGTGYRIDPVAQPELASFADSIATWGDRFAPEPDARNPVGACYPYVGEGYEFQEKVTGSAPFLRNIHCFNFAAIMSYGRTVGDIASLHTGVPRLVSAISRDLFLDDRDHHMRRLTATAPLELTGDEYAQAIWRSKVPLD
jgi:cation diffusion facilitator CzcD-associated flavoprotein CzcO